MPASELETAVKVPRLITLLEVAAMLRLSPHTIRLMVRQNRLQPVRLCRRLLFNPADIERLVAASTRPRMQEEH
jgi:excisionase family DNA binding protein